MNHRLGYSGQNGTVKRNQATINLGGIMIGVDTKTGRITNPKTVEIQFNRAAAGLLNKDRIKPLNVERVENLDLEWIEFWVIMEALERSLFVQSKAAVLLGISSRVMNYKIEKHGIRHQSWRKNKTIT